MSQKERWHLAGNAPEVYERSLVPGIFAPWAHVLVEQVAPQAGERVLDVACGTGVVARLAAQKVGTAGKVVGLDSNAGMLEAAQSLVSAPETPIEWREGDAVDLPFEVGSFDVVCCQLGLQYFADRPRALREMHRVLVPGGRVILLVWRSIVHSPGFHAIAEALDRHVSPEAGAVMRAPFVFGDTTDELRSLLEQGGFRDTIIRSDVRMVRFASAEELVVQQVAGSPLASHVAQVNNAARAALIHEVDQAMRPYSNDAELAFPIEGYIAMASA
jgi:ubiquinone/menaquinone biosynthesis C-methylase UbiE